jgi:4'-phosphopantetheinyl transferase
MRYGERQKPPKITNRLIQKTHPFQERKQIALETDDVHIRLISLETKNAGELRQILSAKELARAERFRLAKDKAEYIVARAFLRIILGKYLNTNPEKLNFEYNKYGKPLVAEAARLKFNMSHSAGAALYAVTLDDDVGVDLELINTSLIDCEIAEQSLTEKEFQRYKKLPADDCIELFYKCWTRKEAYAKAQGNGFITSPNKIETLANKISVFHNTEKKSEFTDNSVYSFYDLPPITGFAAALAVRGSGEKNIRFW